MSSSVKPLRVCMCVFWMYVCLPIQGIRVCMHVHVYIYIFKMFFFFTYTYIDTHTHTHTTVIFILHCFSSQISFHGYLQGNLMSKCDGGRCLRFPAKMDEVYFNGGRDGCDVSPSVAHQAAIHALERHCGWR